MSPNLIMVLSITISILMLVLSVLIGYNLYKGGKEINNDKISKAGLYWLIIIAIFLIISIVSYVSMSNTISGISSSKTQETISAGYKSTYTEMNFEDWSTDLDLEMPYHSEYSIKMEELAEKCAGKYSAQFDLELAYLLHFEQALNESKDSSEKERIRLKIIQKKKKLDSIYSAGLMGLP